MPGNQGIETTADTMANIGEKKFVLSAGVTGTASLVLGIQGKGILSSQRGAK